MNKLIPILCALAIFVVPSLEASHHRHGDDKVMTKKAKMKKASPKRNLVKKNRNLLMRVTGGANVSVEDGTAELSLEDGLSVSFKIPKNISDRLSDHLSNADFALLVADDTADSDARIGIIIGRMQNDDEEERMGRRKGIRLVGFSKVTKVDAEDPNGRILNLDPLKLDVNGKIYNVADPLTNRIVDEAKEMADDGYSESDRNRVCVVRLADGNRALLDQPKQRNAPHYLLVSVGHEGHWSATADEFHDSFDSGLIKVQRDESTFDEIFDY